MSGFLSLFPLVYFVYIYIFWIFSQGYVLVIVCGSLSQPSHVDFMVVYTRLQLVLRSCMSDYLLVFYFVLLVS